MPRKAVLTALMAPPDMAHRHYRLSTQVEPCNKLTLHGMHYSQHLYIVACRQGCTALCLTCTSCVLCSSAALTVLPAPSAPTSRS